MGRAIHSEDSMPTTLTWPHDEVTEDGLTSFEMADYACGLLGPLQKMATEKDMALLGHLLSMAYAEACWQRRQAKS